MNKGIFIIAEAGVNHNGDLNLALQLIDRAAESGANAVKFQTFKAENLVSRGTERTEYQKQSMPGIEEGQLEMLKRLELSFGDFQKLKEYCDKKGINLLILAFLF